jgi:hypothetical protein
LPILTATNGARPITAVLVLLKRVITATKIAHERMCRHCPFDATDDIVMVCRCCIEDCLLMMLLFKMVNDMCEMNECPRIGLAKITF